MADITAMMVRDLRTRTGAGMMDCKKALSEVDGDMEAAIDWLRKKGLSAAAKKAGRAAAEGLVGVHVIGTMGAALEVNTETDFVSRNEQFQGFVETSVHMMAKNKANLGTLKDMPYGDGRTVSEELTHLIAVIGENMEMRRGTIISVEKGVVAQYVHGAVKPGVGRICVLVGLSSDGDVDKLDVLGKQIAMHIAAARPQAVDAAQMDKEIIARERAIFEEQARASGKAEDLIEKMVDGRIRKFYAENALLEQVFIMNTDKKVKDVIEDAAKDIGATITVTEFCLFVLGEGVEKKEDNFSEEVASLAG